MNRLKKVLILVLIAVFSFSFASCDSLLETDEGNAIKAHCITLIDGVLEDDPELSKSALIEKINQESFEKNFAKLKECFANVETYSLTQKRWYSGYNNGQAYYEAAFEMTTNEETYVVTALTVDGYDKLYHFNVTKKSESDVIYTGTLTTLEGSTPLQWFMLVIALALFAFTVWMIVDVIKRKIGKKPLWIIFIVLGAFSLSLNGGVGGLKLGFHAGIYLFQYSRLVIYGSGNFVLSLVLPVGSIVYFFVRKKLKAPAYKPKTVSGMDNANNGENGIINGTENYSDTGIENNTENDTENIAHNNSDDNSDDKNDTI